MATWIRIYLQDNLQNLDTNYIIKGIETVDWWTLAEQFGIEEDEVEKFMKNIKWYDSPELKFEQEGIRPIQIHIWNDTNTIKEMIGELIEINPPTVVRKHLENVKTIVALEFGFEQLKTMFEIIGFEIAFWLAETKHGLILTPWGTWHDHDEYRWEIIK